MLQQQIIALQNEATISATEQEVSREQITRTQEYVESICKQVYKLKLDGEIQIRGFEQERAQVQHLSQELSDAKNIVSQMTNQVFLNF